MTRLLTLAALALVWPAAALAYMGPGAGLGAIGTLLALVGAVLLAFVGFLWYPVKRLLCGRRSASRAVPDAEAEPK